MAVRPYTYSALLADFTTWVRGTPGASRKLAPHGLRVLGYNLSKHANGLDLTVAHGDALVMSNLCAYASVSSSL